MPHDAIGYELQGALVNQDSCAQYSRRTLIAEESSHLMKRLPPAQGAIWIIAF